METKIEHVTKELILISRPNVKVRTKLLLYKDVII